MPRDYSRVQVLARRVGWLDRNRRMFAIAITLVLCPLMLLRVTNLLGSDWPQFHALLIAGTVGVVMWMITETILAWLTAVWETECAHLIREHRVPPARLRRRRRLSPALLLLLFRK